MQDASAGLPIGYGLQYAPLNRGSGIALSQGAWVLYHDAFDLVIDVGVGRTIIHSPNLEGAERHAQLYIKGAGANRRPDLLPLTGFGILFIEPVAATLLSPAPVVLSQYFERHADVPRWHRLPERLTRVPTGHADACDGIALVGEADGHAV